MDLSGKTCIVTGSNTGIGRVTAVELAKRGAYVVLANRSEDKTLPVLEQIRAAGGEAEFLALDLGSLAKTADAAKRFLDGGRRLDVLVNNAGLAGQRGETSDGFELAFGTNHLGPYLHTRLLLPRLREAGSARIVNVSSRAHYRAKGIDYEAVRRPTQSTTGMPEYGVSKLANVLFTKALAAGEAGPGVHSYALHPGVVASDIWRRIPWPFRQIAKLFMVSNEEGAQTSIHCATSDEVAKDDGLYYDRCRPKRPSAVALDPEAARLCWEKSAEMVAPHLAS